MKHEPGHLTGPGIRSIARNAFYLMGSQWVNIIIRLCYVVFLARWLGPKLYGLFNYAMSWYMVMLPLAGLGLGVILGREIPQNPDRQSDILSGTFSLRIFSSVFCALLCALSGLLLEKNPEAKILLLVFSSALLGRSVAFWTANVFTAYEASHYTFIFHSIFRFVELLLSLTYIFFDGGVLGLSVIHSLSWWSQGIFGIFWIKKAFSPMHFRIRKKELKSYFRRGLVLGIFSVSSTFILQGPLVLYRYISGLGENLGQLALAMQALILLSTLPGYMTAGALPVLSRSVLRGDGKARFFTESMIRVTIIAGTALALSGLAIFPWLIERLFGPSYGDTGLLLGWTLWLLIPLTTATVITSIFQARGEYTIPTLFSLIGAAILLLAIYPMTSMAGQAGVIAAMGIALFIESAGLVMAAQRSGQLNIRASFFKPILTALAASLVFLILKDRLSLSLLASLAVLSAGTVLFRIYSPGDIFALRHILKSFLPSSKTEEP